MLAVGVNSCRGSDGFFIGEVARQTGPSIHTLRFYEAERLLPESPRTDAGHRVYSPQNVRDLKFIRRAQELGFTLKEIRELLVLKDRRRDTCGHVLALLNEEIGSVCEKRRELEKMEKELRRVMTQCRRQLKVRHPGPGKDCPVLANLGREPGAESVRLRRIGPVV